MMRHQSFDRLPGPKTVLFDHPEHGIYYQRAGVVMCGKQTTEAYKPAYFDKWAAIPQKQIDGVSEARHDLLAKFVQTEWHSVLDFGCGMGDFIDYGHRRYPKSDCKNFYGYDIRRNERNKALATTFHSRAPIMVREWDVVTFWDSLEHIEDPLGLLDKLNTRYVVLSVPNADLILFHMPEPFFRWRHCRPTEHIWHFNMESVQNFMRVAGFKMLVSCHPEDAYRPGPEGQPFPNILSAVFEKEAHLRA